MSFFEDKVYDNLDWLSQATMPLVFSGNKLLADMPDRIDIDLSNVGYNLGLGMSVVLESYRIENVSMDSLLKDCYTFMSIGDTIDPANNTLPTIWAEKITKNFSDKAILIYVKNQIHKPTNAVAVADVGRTNEILDLIDYRPDKTRGEKDIRSSRSMKKKIRAINNRLTNIFMKNEWQVKDADLMISFADWTYQYMVTGNLAALTNITKLKIMTHKKQAIYSIKETV